MTVAIEEKYKNFQLSDNAETKLLIANALNKIDSCEEKFTAKDIDIKEINRFFRITRREAYIINRRIATKSTFRDISEDLNISSQRVFQLEYGGIRKLRQLTRKLRCEELK